MKKIVALMAIAFGVVAPSSVLAASATYDGTLTVNAWSQGGGTVAVSQNTTPGEYGTTESSHYQQTASAISSILLPGSKSFTFYAFAKPNVGYKFAGWFTSDACEGSPESENADGYTVTFSVNKNKSDEKTYFAKFVSEASKIDIEDTDITLNPSTANYTGSAQTTTVTVKYGTATLVENEDYTVSGDTTATGSGSDDKTYTVTITGIGDNYEGSVDKTWTIKAPSGKFDDDALSTSASGCTASGNTVTVADSTKLAYVAENTWQLAAQIEFPREFPTSLLGGDTSKYIGVDQVWIGDDKDGETKLKTDVKEYKALGSVVASHTYADYLTWEVPLTLSDVTSAIGRGENQLEYTITVGALAWDRYTTGIKPTTFTLTIPLEGIVLNDEAGNQVYPHVDYVAQIGTKKFETLGAALTAAEAGETVTLIEEAEAGEFAISAGVTLDLAGFGNAAATYVIDANESGIATVKSTKEETVSATTGYRVVTDTTTEPGIYIYTPELAHQHSWTFKVEEDGVTLTATCGNPSCTIDGAALQLQLQGVDDKTYDGKGISPKIVDIEIDGYNFRDLIEGVTVGEITYTRPNYSAEKWYTGAYTASCEVTISGTPYTLTKSFNILPTEYTDGFVASVNELSVRFDTLLEATVVANEGDTIYYKGGNLTGQKVTFSSSKNITLDLGWAKLQRDAYQTVTLTNDGAGTVTLTNGTIVQPKAGGALGSAGQMDIEGNFAFAEIETKNRATSATNFFKLTVKSGTVTVLGGKYTSQFVADGGTVVYQGGQFWDGKYNSRAYFTKPTPDTGYIVIPGSGSIKDGNDDDRALVWEIVEHTHNVVYAAAGNVITATCDAENHEYCGYGEETLTLTAEPREATGEPYEGASIEYSENFPVKDAEIVYFDGDQELQGAPTEVGEEYIAKVTVGDATAEAAFAITHIHSFSYNALDAMTIGVKCTTEIGTCEFQDWKTATLTAADSKTYDGNPYAASFKLEEGFPTDYVTVSLEYWVKNGEKLDDAPSAAGDYTVKMIASEGDTTKYTLEKDFAIAPADLSGATIALSTTSFNFDGYEKNVSISSVKFGGMTLVEDVDYEISEESVFKATGEGRIDETFTVKIVGIAGRNFAGEATANWKIIAGKERDDFKFGAGTAGGEYGEVVDKTLTVTDSTKLVYNGDGTWSMAMNVALPIDGNASEHYVPTTKLYFRNPQTGAIVIGDNEADCSAIGVKVKDTFAFDNYRCATSFDWTEELSLSEIEAAIAAGDDKIVRTLKTWSPKWSDSFWAIVTVNIDNHNGLPVTEYKMEIPLADLVLPVAADTELKMAGTQFATEKEFDAYMLTLGKGAKVYGDPNYEDEEGYFGYLPNEGLLKTDVEGYNVGCDDSDESNIFYTTVAKKYNLAYEFVDEDGNALDGVTNPYQSKKTYTIEDEIIFSEAATLEGYEFIEWSPAKIEKGTTGKQVITGNFKLIPVLPTATYAPATVENCDIGLTYTLGTAAVGYDDWNVDFVVKANKDVANGAITLWGANPLDGETLVNFPTFAMTEEEEIKLLASQSISITYAQLIAVMTTYTCGVQNNSLAEDTEFTLKIVLSKEGEEDIVVEGSTFNTTLKAKTINPVVPGEEIDIPADKDPEEYAGEVEAQKATLLKAPVELTGTDLETYQGYFTAKVVGAMVQFVLNESGEEAVKSATEATKSGVLDVALSADEGTFTVAEPLAGFYYSFKQGGKLTNLGFVKVDDKNQIGDTISFELVKPEGKGFYQTIVTPVPYEEK